MRLLAEFAYLQILDILTTIVFLMQGVGEANPLVRWALGQGNPLVALVGVKILGLALAAFCVYRSRDRLMRRVNVLFACLIVYNLVVILVTSPAIAG